MVNQVLQFSIKADTSNAVAEIKPVGPAIESVGTSAAKTSEKLSVAEQISLRTAKSFGIELSSGLQRSVDKLEALQQHLIKTNAPASDLEKVSAKLSEAQNR